MLMRHQSFADNDDSLNEIDVLTRRSKAGLSVTVLVILGFLMVMSGATRAADEPIGTPPQTRAAEPGANQNLAAGEQAAGNLKEAPLGAAPAGDFSVSAALTRAALATVLLLLVVWILRRLGTWGVSKLESTTVLARRVPPILVTDLQPHLARAIRSLIRLVMAAAILVLGYLWLVYVFEQFSYTAPWGERLGDFLVALLAEVGTGILGALPGLFIVLVIFLIARWCVRIVNVVFKEIQAGTFTLPGFEPETARTPQTLLVFAIWLFALEFRVAAGEAGSSAEVGLVRSAGRNPRKESGGEFKRRRCKNMTARGARRTRCGNFSGQSEPVGG